jgi:hypothetical protein
MVFEIAETLVRTPGVKETVCLVRNCHKKKYSYVLKDSRNGKGNRERVDIDS